jgi:hypothetical protein
MTEIGFNKKKKKDHDKGQTCINLTETLVLTSCNPIREKQVNVQVRST